MALLKKSSITKKRAFVQIKELYKKKSYFAKKKALFPPALFQTAPSDRILEATKY